MEILFKDRYKIQIDRYNWILYKKNILEKDSRKRDGSLSKKKGDFWWSEEGFFTSLDTLLNKIVRLEHDADQNTYDITEFLSMWYAIVKKFKEEVEVV